MRLTKVGLAAAVAALFAAPLALSACTHGPVSAVWHAKGSNGKPLTVNVTPAAGAANLPITTEIAATAAGGKVTDVSMTDAGGRAVPGAMRPDGSSWVPGIQLTYGAKYRATVNATGPNGQKQSKTTTFTTMADPGTGDAITSTLYVQDGQTYGVGMPVAVQFDAPIPNSDKAAVERRLFVQSSPAQPGVWHWFGDDQVLYRPQNYWQSGTKVTVRTALGGLKVGDRYLDTDRTGTATIGGKMVFQVDNATKKMQVFQNDKLVKTFPVSLGQSSTPTSSGNMVLMTHEYTSLFDVPGEYRVDVMYAERFTWDGQYLHAAPWSEGQQGYENVSHGCVNLSQTNAGWVYENSKIGDPVSVTGTEVHITPGDGWTVWDMTWPDYIKGSALPHQDLLNQATSESATGQGKNAPHVN